MTQYFIGFVWLVVQAVMWSVSSTAAAAATTAITLPSTSASTTTAISFREDLSNAVIQPTPGCTVVEVNGYLHQQCGFTLAWDYSNWKYRWFLVYKCPRSDERYYIGFGSNDTRCEQILYIDRCPSDPGSYQACGHGGCSGYMEVRGTPLWNVLLF